MGLCIAFGPQIREGCQHPMVAAADACFCAECGVKCLSKFEGCREVWAGAPPVPADFVERPARRAQDSFSASDHENVSDPASDNTYESSAYAPEAAAYAPEPAAVNGLVIETEVSELRSRVAELIGTVERLVGVQESASRRQDDALATIGGVEHELKRVEERVAALESETQDTLDRHRDAIRTVGGRVKKLEHLSSGAGGSMPRPQSPPPRPS